MRSWLPLLLAAGLCACDRLPGGHGNESGAADEDPTANLQVVDRNADPVHIRDLIARAMPAALPGAKDAQYRALRLGVGGAVCGEVAEKPAGRAPQVFRPFVINADGLAVVAATPKLAYEDPSDFVADAWIRWCATPEELAKLAPAIRRAARDPASAPMNAAAPAPDA
ncbi:MAG: hypothetical protein ACJ8EB_09330, partial [Allosphingosinicella sp.]